MGLTWEGDQRNIKDPHWPQDHAACQLSRAAHRPPGEEGPGWHTASPEARAPGASKGGETLFSISLQTGHGCIWLEWGQVSSRRHSSLVSSGKP